MIKRSPLRVFAGLARYVFLRLWYARSLQTQGWSIIDRDVSFFLLKGGQASLGHRVFLGRGAEIQARWGKLSIGPGTTINHFSRVVAFESITIGARCAIAQFVSILDHDHAYQGNEGMDGYKTAAITIGDDVWIGDKATILRGVTIGNRARIGSGAVVTRDVPADCLAVGVPARILPLPAKSPNPPMSTTEQKQPQ